MTLKQLFLLIFSSVIRFLLLFIDDNAKLKEGFESLKVQHRAINTMTIALNIIVNFTEKLPGLKTLFPESDQTS